MSPEPDPCLTMRLRDVLSVEADQVQVSPDARAELLRRIRVPRPPRPRRRLQWLSPAALVVALGLIAAVGVLLIHGRWERSAVPAPVAAPTPGMTATTSSTPTPVSGVTVSDLPTTLVYYPGPDGRLLAEPRLRSTLFAAVAAIGAEPTNETVSWPFGSMTLADVTQQGGTVVVDYSADAHVRPTDPDAEIATFWTQSLVHTVAAYTGRPTPVRVTLEGSSFLLFDRLDTDEPFRLQQVDTGLTVGLTLPNAVPTPRPVPVVGALGSRGDRLAWTVSTSSGRTVTTGSTALNADRTFAFAVALPAGQYEVRVAAEAHSRSSGESYHTQFEVT